MLEVYYTAVEAPSLVISVLKTHEYQQLYNHQTYNLLTIRLIFISVKSSTLTTPNMVF